MSADFPVVSKIVSPAKHNEKPWDLWVSELGHISPLRDDEATFATPASADGKTAPPPRRRGRRSRLRADAVSLHAQFPQLDALDAAVCSLCGGVLKCSAALRHLRDAHRERRADCLPPPPAPAAKPKPTASRSRHKKEPVPLVPVEPPTPPLPQPVAVEPPPVAAASRIPAADLQYVEEPAVDLQGCGDLPVVSIQDTDELPLGENITDDIFAIMNSEGIESADDITNAADWKNIIRDIGNMGDLNFSQPTDGQAGPDMYAPVDAAALSALALSDVELAALALPPPAAPARPPPVAPPVAPPPAPPVTPRAKAGKAKPLLREYDPNKHCGVVTLDNPKPCTRSLTCKAHALSLRRTVEGRAKPFDTLLAEHRAARDAPPPPEPAPLAAAPPPPQAALEPAGEPGAPEAAAPELYWYGGAPRPLALCTFNACAAGGAVTLGKRFATVRSSLKSALSRGGCGASGAAAAAAGAARRAARPELRRLLAAPRRDARLNGHVGTHVVHKTGKRTPMLSLAFALDPLLADDKC